MNVDGPPDFPAEESNDCARCHARPASINDLCLACEAAERKACATAGVTRWTAEALALPIDGGAAPEPAPEPAPEAAPGPLPGGMEEFLGSHPDARGFRELDAIFAAHDARVAAEKAAEPPMITVTHRPDLDRPACVQRGCRRSAGPAPMEYCAEHAEMRASLAVHDEEDGMRAARERAPGRDENGVPRRELVHELGPTFPALLSPPPEPAPPRRGDQDRRIIPGVHRQALPLLPARHEGMLDAEILAEALGSKADVGAIAVHLLHCTDDWSSEDPIAVLAAAVRVLGDYKAIKLSDPCLADARDRVHLAGFTEPGGAKLGPATLCGFGGPLPGPAGGAITCTRCAFVADDRALALALYRARLERTKHEAAPTFETARALTAAIAALVEAEQSARATWQGYEEVAETSPAETTRAGIDPARLAVHLSPLMPDELETFYAIWQSALRLGLLQCVEATLRPRDRGMAVAILSDLLGAAAIRTPEPGAAAFVEAAADLHRRLRAPAVMLDDYRAPGCIEEGLVLEAMARLDAIEAGARNLARSIFADVRRYWSHTYETRADLPLVSPVQKLEEQIVEGRRLFARRALRELAYVYGDELRAGLTLTTLDRERFTPAEVEAWDAAVADLYLNAARKLGVAGTAS